jgi:predicted transcriptional regulator
MVFTDNDYKILREILDRNNEKKGLCKGNGTSIKEIITKTGLSENKVRQTLKKFTEEGFIEEGITLVRAKTFILTVKGFEELKTLRTNIFGED